MKLEIIEYTGAYANSLAIAAQSRIDKFIGKEKIHWIESVTIVPRNLGYSIQIEGEWSLPDGNVKDILQDVINGEEVLLRSRVDFTDAVAMQEEILEDWKPTFENEIPIPKLEQNQQPIDNDDIPKHLDNDLEREFMAIIQETSTNPIFTNRQRVALAKRLAERETRR